MRTVAAPTAIAHTSRYQVLRSTSLRSSVASGVVLLLLTYCNFGNSTNYFRSVFQQIDSLLFSLVRLYIRVRLALVPCFSSSCAYRWYLGTAVGLSGRPVAGASSSAPAGRSRQAPTVHRAEGAAERTCIVSRVPLGAPCRAVR